jgi:hypothetical protein
MWGNGSLWGGRGRGSGGRPSRVFKITFVPSDPWVPTLPERPFEGMWGHIGLMRVQSFSPIGSELKEKVYVLLLPESSKCNSASL